MRPSYCLIVLPEKQPAKEGQALFYPSDRWLADVAASAGISHIHIIEQQMEAESLCASLQQGTLKALSMAAKELPPGAGVLSFCLPVVALSSETVRALLLDGGGVLWSAGHLVAACFCERERLLAAGNLAELADGLRDVRPTCPEEAVPLSTETLSDLNGFLRRRRNRALAGAGVVIPDLDGVWVSPEVEVAPSAVLMPGTILRGRSKIGQGTVIGPNCLLEDAVVGPGTAVNSSQIYQSQVGENATVGPFAYIRPGCVVGDRARVGDFVELKNTHLGAGTKVSHLTYVGDARVGERVNFGCGTVTVNYDGNGKYITKVGDDVFLGCNTNLVAPVDVGRGAYVAAGSTVTSDVPEDALCIARARQVNKEGWAQKKRDSWKEPK